MKNLFVFLLMAIFLNAGCQRTPVEAGKSKIRKLTNHAYNVFVASYTPDGSKIIYATSKNDNGDIYLMNSDGSNHAVLLENVGIVGNNPAISPTGQQFAFTASRNTPSGSRSTLTVCNIDGTNARTIIEASTSLFDPHFSLDGSLILYGLSSNIHSVHIITVDGTNDKKLSGAVSSDPISFSPDGTKILFASSTDGFKFGAFTMDLNGKNINRITDPSLSLFPVAYSPEGGKILCQARLEDRGELNREVYIINSNGTNLKRITNNIDQDFPIAFSPDGKKILFYSYKNSDRATETWEMYLIDIDGSNLTPLTNNNFRDFPIGFSPDGKRILFQSDRDGLIALYAMELN